MNSIHSSEQHRKDEETIVAAEEGFDVVVEKPPLVLGPAEFLVPDQRLQEVEVVQLVLDEAL